MSLIILYIWMTICPFAQVNASAYGNLTWSLVWATCRTFILYLLYPLTYFPSSDNFTIHFSYHSRLLRTCTFVLFTRFNSCGFYPSLGVVSWLHIAPSASTSSASEIVRYSAPKPFLLVQFFPQLQKFQTSEGLFLRALQLYEASTWFVQEVRQRPDQASATWAACAKSLA